MKYKEFRNWCNDRCFDGYWGYREALICLNVISEIDKLPFWKRKKAWKDKKEFLVNNIINPINKAIKKLEEANKIVEKENQKLKEENENGIC